MYVNVRPLRIYQQIVEQIQELILTGKLQPGDQLSSERELAEQLGVSRTAVREAIKALVEKGLVEIQPGKGTFITNGTPQVLQDSLELMFRFGPPNNVTDVNQIRAILEPGIAALAAQHATANDIQKMQQAIRTMDQAMEDADVFVEADLEFHLALATATQNKLITILLTPIIDFLREERLRIFLVDGGPQRGQHHHKQILKAIIQQDATAAHDAMTQHLHQVMADSSTAINEEKGREEA